MILTPLCPLLECEPLPAWIASRDACHAIGAMHHDENYGKLEAVASIIPCPIKGPVMPYSPMPVKILAAHAFAAVPIRTLRTLAHYTHYQRLASQTRAGLATDLLCHWTTPAYRRLVRQSLTATDYALLHALWAGEHPLPDPNTLDLWRWQAPWPTLASLSSLQRLAVLGFLLPIRTPLGRQTVLLRDTTRWLRRVRPAPAPPTPASFQSLFQAVAELLIHGSIQPLPAATPGSMARTLAQSAGWLVLRLEQWRTTPRGIAWVQASLAEQERLLQHQIVRCSPPDSGLPAWRNPDWATLWQAFEALMHDHAPRRMWDVLALLWAHPAWGTLPDDQRGRLFGQWLRQVLQPAGVVSLAQGWVFWHGWSALTVTAPPFDGLLLPATPHLPPLLRWWATYWGQPTHHGWRISVAAVTARVQQDGDLMGVWEPLDAWYAARPPAVESVGATVAARPRVRLRQVMLVEGRAEALTVLEQQRGMQGVVQAGWAATHRVIAAEAVAQVARAVGLPSPRQSAPPREVETLVLALRIAAQHVPSHATAFQGQAQQLLADLSFAQRCVIDEQWEGLHSSLTPPLAIDAEPLAVGQQPRAQITVDHARQVVREAIQAGHALTVRYYTPSAHRITTRTIRPLELTSTGVRGWCELRQEERAFRFDRVLAVTVHHESG